LLGASANGNPVHIFRAMAAQFTLEATLRSFGVEILASIVLRGRPADDRRWRITELETLEVAGAAVAKWVREIVRANLA
jgi:hypothetical protein